jgi:hypothetical protein
MPPEQQMPPPMAGAIAAPPGAAMPKTGSGIPPLPGGHDPHGVLWTTHKASGAQSPFVTHKGKTGIMTSARKFYPVAQQEVDAWTKAFSSSLAKQAMDYAKSGRPHSGLVLDDLAAATSLERIKEAIAGRADYPMANPYGELIRTKQKLAKLLEDATYAKDKNADLHKEATARFQKAVVQHMYDGGNLAEVAHLMSAAGGDPGNVKTAMSLAMKELLRHGIDPVKAQADAIQYEMVKGASVRVPNLDHPIAQAYADLCKLADGGAVLREGWAQIRGQYRQVESVLQEAMTHAAAS